MSALTVQIHRYTGPDEDFEADGDAEALELATAEWRNHDVRRVVILNEDALVLEDWVR